VAYYDEHGLNQQRAYQIVCLMVGFNGEKFKDLAKETKLYTAGAPGYVRRGLQQHCVRTGRADLPHPALGQELTPFATSASIDRYACRAASALGKLVMSRAQAEQNRRGAKDCFVRPLALGFYAEVVANFGKCHLDLPPADEPSENVAGASVEVGGEESLRLEFACRTRSQRIGLRRTRSSGS
jgi:hypothetical protein